MLQSIRKREYVYYNILNDEIFIFDYSLFITGVKRTIYFDDKLVGILLGEL